MGRDFPNRKMKFKKNIWYISKYFMAPNEAYVGQRGHYLSKELEKIGYKMTVINSNSFNKIKSIKLKNLYNFRNIDGVNYITIKTKKYDNSYSINRLISWFDFEIKLCLLPLKEIYKPDIVIVSSLSLLTIINGIFFKLIFKSKLIFEIRDIWPLSLIEYKGYSRNNIFILLLRFIEYIGYRFSDQIIGTMPLLSEHVNKIIGKNNKVRNIPNGFNIKMLENNNISNKRINNILNSDMKVITYIGSIGISNNLDAFFKTIKNLSSNNELYFLVIGDGELKKKYKDKYGNLKNLFISDEVDNRFVNNILSRSSILYFSLSNNKIWDYGQSLNKIINYMLSGKPIIASYSGHRSMLNEANCGEFIEVDNFIELEKAFIKYSKLSKKESSIIGMRGKNWLLRNRSYKKLALDYSMILEKL